MKEVVTIILPCRCFGTYICSEKCFIREMELCRGEEE